METRTHRRLQISSVPQQGISIPQRLLQIVIKLNHKSLRSFFMRHYHNR